MIARTHARAHTRARSDPSALPPSSISSDRLLSPRREISRKKKRIHKKPLLLPSHFSLPSLRHSSKGGKKLLCNSGVVAAAATTVAAAVRTVRAAAATTCNSVR